MEIIEVVGLRDVSFKDGDRLIEGSTIYLLIAADGVVGMKADKLFVGRDRSRNMEYFPKVGDKCAVSYDRYGKPTQFKPIK